MSLIIIIIIFCIFWSKMKITQADASIIQMDCYPS